MKFYSYMHATFLVLIGDKITIRSIAVGKADVSAIMRYHFVHHLKLLVHHSTVVLRGTFTGSPIVSLSSLDEQTETT